MIGWDVPNLMKNVTNLMNDVPNFVMDVPMVPKCVPKWELAPNHFLMGSKMKSWTLGTLFTKFGTSFIKFGTFFIKFGTSDSITSGTPI